MSARGDGMLLGVLLGGVSRSWHQPWSRSTEATSLSLYADLARAAEAAKIHTLFLADTVTVDEAAPSPGLEPVTLLSALAGLTERIGLVASVSTSFTEPYNVARQIASLDHLSGGRAGWNVVTSAWGERNFGRSAPGVLPDHDDRYAIAEEFTSLVEALWDSWEDDAIVRDVERRLLVDPARVHRVDWRSPHFTVDGPLNVPRTPQGRPVIAQAGSSEAGLGLGARHADLVFTTGLTETAPSVRLRADLRRRAAAAGRSPDDLKVLPGVAPVVASSDAEARRIWEESHELLDLDAARAGLTGQFGGVDLSDLPLDARLPVDKLPDEDQVQGRRSRYGVLLRLVRSGELRTVRDLVLHHASAAGHWFPIGSVENVADQLQERWEAGGADGFNFLPFYLNYPGGLEALTEGLVPELRRRGLFQTDYRHTTLRANLGLAPHEPQEAIA